MNFVTGDDIVINLNSWDRPHLGLGRTVSARSLVIPRGISAHRLDDITRPRAPGPGDENCRAELYDQ